MNLNGGTFSLKGPFSLCVGIVFISSKDIYENVVLTISSLTPPFFLFKKNSHIIHFLLLCLRRRPWIELQFRNLKTTYVVSESNESSNISRDLHMSFIRFKKLQLLLNWCIVVSEEYESCSSFPQENLSKAIVSLILGLFS